MVEQVTNAWIIRKGIKSNSTGPEAADLISQQIPVRAPTSHEVVVRPILGCWEANMSHAIARSPIDVCRARNEDWVVLGNSGVVEIEEVGSEVTTLTEGDICIIYGNAISDSHGYMKLAFAYDAPNTIGLLAQRLTVPEYNCLKIPTNTRHSLVQWATFSVRFITAWANWRVAYGCWKTQMHDSLPTVWAWGGGTALAELLLAKQLGCNVALICSGVSRLALTESLGVIAIDRSEFEDLQYDDARYNSCRDYRRRYNNAEKTFLRIVNKMTDGGVSIFIDNIGTPVHRATLRALARQGVITTAGWKHGMHQSSVRAVECISRHIHVHTHYATREEAINAILHAEETDWLPQAETEVFKWEDIPKLADAYANGDIRSYWPLFEVNKPGQGSWITKR